MPSDGSRFLFCCLSVSVLKYLLHIKYRKLWYNTLVLIKLKHFWIRLQECFFNLQ
ncbi:hypothetical protein HMPREF0346_3130 [Enterococcus faecalis EnGen0297]|nr:hypothetical protein HMPREF0346_3130 [Enterococcus faecalis EnGen0297]